MCVSALEIASEPDDIEFVSFHDNDDVSVYEYVGNHKEVRGERTEYNINMMANECCKIATGDIYYFGNDDSIFETKEWDKRVKETFEKYPDKIVLVCPNNGTWNTWRFGTEAFVHRNWIETVGYILAPYPHAVGADRWINEVAVALGRQVYLEDVKKKHLQVRDRVHYEKSKRGSQLQKGYGLPEMVEARQRDIRVLQEFINNFKHEN